VKIDSPLKDSISNRVDCWEESSLGLFDFALQFTHSPEVGADVGTGFLLVQLDEVINDAIIEALSSKMGITGGSQDFKDTIINGKERNIKRSSSEIVDDDLRFSAFLVETVGDSGGGGFVDDTENVRPAIVPASLVALP
jgi:hypothetical protein